jgi:CRP-like cAMP-binding protein
MLAQPKHRIVNELADLKWPLIKKLASLQELDFEEIDYLRKLHEKTLVIKKQQDLISYKSIHNQYIIINQGWACRFSVLQDGGRQIINYYLPGDIINLAGIQSSHSILSITPLFISTFKEDALHHLFTHYPKLDSLYKQMICSSEAMLAEQVVRIGRRSAYQGTIHLLLELFQRLNSIGQTNQNSFQMPLTQELLADTLGMSIVHMNRTLHKLRDDGLIEMQSNKINLLNLPKLEQLAEYEGVLLEPKVAVRC